MIVATAATRSDGHAHQIDQYGQLVVGVELATRYSHKAHLLAKHPS
jgi:hypothetical protein